jgi:hypothetical protein
LNYASLSSLSSWEEALSLQTEILGDTEVYCNYKRKALIEKYMCLIGRVREMEREGRGRVRRRRRLVDIFQKFHQNKPFYFNKEN